MMKSKSEMVGEPPFRHPRKKVGTSFRRSSGGTTTKKQKYLKANLAPLKKRKDIRRIHATVTWREENILSIELEMEASRALNSFLSVLFFRAELCTVQCVHSGRNVVEAKCLRRTPKNLILSSFILFLY